MKYCFWAMLICSGFDVDLIFFFNKSAEQNLVHHYTLIHFKKINSRCVQFYNACCAENCNIIIITLNDLPNDIG